MTQRADDPLEQALTETMSDIGVAPGDGPGRYANELRMRLAQMQILGVARTREFGDLYTPSRATPSVRSMRDQTVAEVLDNLKATSSAGAGPDVPLIADHDLVRGGVATVVLGEPGSGKSTLLSYLALEYADQGVVPLLVQLRYWKEGSVFQNLVSQLSDSGVLQAETVLTSLLSGGRCALLLDAVDEVRGREKRDALLADISELSYRYSDASYFLSCRSGSYHGNWIPHFDTVEVAPFGADERRHYVERWFANEPEVARECLATLEDSRHARELSARPLFLSLLCAFYGRKQAIPENVADLFEPTLRALLEDWDDSRRVRRDPFYANLSVRQRELILGGIAWRGMVNNRFAWDERALGDDLADEARSFVRDVSVEAEIDGKEILRDIESKHGILVKQTRSIYTFLHLSFQEYYAANHVARGRGSSLREELLPRIGERSWTHVIVFAVAMLNEPDDYVQQLRAAAREALVETELEKYAKLILRKADRPPTALAPVLSERLAVLYVLSQLGTQANWLDGSLSQALGRSVTPSQDLLKALSVRLRVGPAELEEMMDTVELASQRFSIDPVRFANNILAPLRSVGSGGLFDELAASRGGGVHAMGAGAFRRLGSYVGSDLDLEANDTARSIRSPVKRFGQALGDYFRLSDLLVECVNAGALISGELRADLLEDPLGSRELVTRILDL